MCGIVGYYGHINPALLKEMLQLIKHRGPDDEGIFVGKNIGLGIRRLAIVDPKKGHQPIFNEDKSMCIVFNGEIYNFLKIKKELESLGHRFQTKTDTEVVIHAFEEWGKNCLRKFNGMFAFAIWNQKDRSLYLVRDRIGIKPLYYHYNNKRLLFASEIKALLVDKDIVKVKNESAIISYLLTGFGCENETFFKNINELKPGHFMVINLEGINTFKYWDIPQESSLLSNRASDFFTLLIDAIRIRIPPELSLTHYLSGGLDSSAILCITNNIILKNKKNRKENNTILTASYDSLWDEKPYADEVSKFLKTNITYVYPSNVISWDDLISFIYYLDEPVTVLNYYAYWCLARVTKSKSKVIFMGQGPDEYLAGHVDHHIIYLRELLVKKRYLKMFKEISAYIYTELRRGDIKDKIRRIYYKLRTHSYIKDMINENVIKLYSVNEINSKPNSLRESLIHDVKERRLPMHLRVGDRIASAFSLEFRCPYLDHRIIELSFSIPSNYKIKNGTSKYILRKAVKEVIPEKIMKRRKQGTPIPVESWLKQFRSEIICMMKSNQFLERGYFNSKNILKFYDQYCNDEINQFEKEYYEVIFWRIINMELWLEQFFG